MLGIPFLNFRIVWFELLDAALQFIFTVPRKFLLDTKIVFYQSLTSNFLVFVKIFKGNAHI